MNKSDLVSEWLEIASNDLTVAHHLFDTMHPKPLEIICYHCQQAVEKSLKGYLIDRDVEPPYIHDLEKLHLMCLGHDASFDTIEKACLRLNNYSASTRYPNRPEVMESDAAYALREAERILDVCTSLIPSLHVVRQEQAQSPEQTM